MTENLVFLDIIMLIGILWYAYKGFVKGLVVELASLAALVLGIYIAYHFSDFTSELLRNTFHMQSEYLHIIAFAITFFAVVIATHLLGKIIDAVVNIAMLGIVNKLAGLVFGVLKIGLVISGLFYIIATVDTHHQIITKETQEKSLLYKPVSSLVYKIIPVVEDLNHDFNRDSQTQKRA